MDCRARVVVCLSHFDSPPPMLAATKRLGGVARDVGGVPGEAREGQRGSLIGARPLEGGWRRGALALRGA